MNQHGPVNEKNSFICQKKKFMFIQKVSNKNLVSLNGKFFYTFPEKLFSAKRFISDVFDTDFGYTHHSLMC